MATAIPLVAGRTPEGLLVPESKDELRSLVVERNGRTLVPVAGRTATELGNAPEGPFDLLDISSALGSDFEHQSEDMTLVVSAGMPLREVHQRLHARGQWLPLDPAGSGDATMGGIFATGVSGPLRTGFGQPRDLLLGASVLRADGQEVKAGGRVVKNVTGYDLMRLWTGSLGTLGIFTSLSLRVFPLRNTVDLEADVESVREGCRLADAVLRADLRPQAVEVLRRPGRWTLFVRLAEEALGSVQMVVPRLAPTDGEGLYLACREFEKQGALSVRIATLPTQVPEFAAAVEQLNPEGMLTRPIAGQVRATWDEGQVPPAELLARFARECRTRLDAIGGSLVFERMPAELRDSLECWGTPNPGALAIMREVKRQYDPDGRFNRGRFAGGI